MGECEGEKDNAGVGSVYIMLYTPSSTAVMSHNPRVKMLHCCCILQQPNLRKFQSPKVRLASSQKPTAVDQRSRSPFADVVQPNKKAKRGRGIKATEDKAAAETRS